MAELKSGVATAPKAGTEYPANWNAFLDWFPSEEACLAYMERLRWPEGFRCPSCGESREPYRSSRGRLICRTCAHQSTVTAGTLFDKTRTPLRVWFAAAWYVTNQKHGVSALGLQRVLGLGSYETAWAMLHRFRRAMVRAGREPLRGHVEVDETYLAFPIAKRQFPTSAERAAHPKYWSSLLSKSSSRRDSVASDYGASPGTPKKWWSDSCRK
jgi:transposase-like protein